MSTQGPWSEAWTRLRRDWIAMSGLIVATAMVAAVVAAPWLSPCAPTEQRHWLGAMPPGITHPDCREIDALALGQPPELSTRLPRDGHLRVLTETSDGGAHHYRVVVRRGVMQLSEEDPELGAQRLDTLDLATIAAEVEHREGHATPAPRLLLKSGDPPPEGLLDPGEAVAILRSTPTPHAVSIEATLSGGAITALRLDGADSPRISLRGEDIRRVEVDGRELRLRHWLGTDVEGRDLLARILFGGRISLMVGAVATLVSLVIGVAYGAISGYSGGRTDRTMMSAVDVLYAVPFMFLVIILLVYCGSSFLVLFAALGAVQWLTMARIVRGQVLSLRHREFVLAAVSSGVSHSRILFRHLIPNCIGPVIVYGTLTVPMVIMEESFLAFIGLGVQQNGVDSWGALIQQGHAQLTPDRTWMLVYPALAMAGTLLAINCLGEGLRDALDPRRR
jgi:oligopeptide transport system permease protein